MEGQCGPTTETDEGGEPQDLPSRDSEDQRDQEDGRSTPVRGGGGKVHESCGRRRSVVESHRRAATGGGFGEARKRRIEHSIWEEPQEDMCTGGRLIWSKLKVYTRRKLEEQHLEEETEDRAHEDCTVRGDCGRRSSAVISRRHAAEGRHSEGTWTRKRGRDSNGEAGGEVQGHAEVGERTRGGHGSRIGEARRGTCPMRGCGASRVESTCGLEGGLVSKSKIKIEGCMAQTALSQGDDGHPPGGGRCGRYEAIDEAQGRWRGGTYTEVRGA